MRVRGCVHMLVLISPSSPLSLCPHIQMSQHLSCKCLPAHMIRRRTCLWPRFPFAFLCASVRVHLCVCVASSRLNDVFVCVTRSRWRPASPSSQQCRKRRSEGRRLALVSISEQSSKGGEEKRLGPVKAGEIPR